MQGNTSRFTLCLVWIVLKLSRFCKPAPHISQVYMDRYKLYFRGLRRTGLDFQDLMAMATVHLTSISQALTSWYLSA